MFTVAVKRHFLARHFLIGGDWGSENQEHSHSYDLEISLEGPRLNKHGYLMDIMEIQGRLDRIMTVLNDSLLNELAEFDGLNPSIELLADLCCRWLLDGLKRPPISAVSVKVFEDDSAWASCRRKVP
jgi:6-pyruvoyltetrahydropterin/6-carboxytetrahydropterin synthase